MMTPEEVREQVQHIAYWQRAARRAQREGNPALAISFRNMAWLVEHREAWLKWVAAQDVTMSEQSTDTPS